MKALYSLILASGTKEALFAALWLALGETPGTFADVDFATLRATAARFGVALSESQVRKRVKELEKLDVLALVPRRERGRFDLLVFQPAPNRFNVDANEPKPEPATPLFDAAFGKGVESFVGDGAIPDGDGAAPDPRFRANSVSAPVGRDALAQLRADSVSAAKTVSETETRTGTVAKSIAKPAASVAADHFREAAKMIQPPEFATCAASSFAVEATENHAETPNRFAIDRDRSRLAPPESESREPFATPLEEINIKNKTINKPANDFGAEAQASVDATSVADVRLAVEAESPKDVASRPDVAEVRSLVDFESPKDAASRPDVADVRSLVDVESPKDAASRPDVADVRSLVDFASPKVAALRREIVDRVWEPTVHPDLIDRLTAAVVLRVGGSTRSTVFALIREACDAKSLFERSNGRVGKRTIWETAALRIKRLFENAGWRWSPTRFADEPRPSRFPVAPVEANDERERTGRTSSATTERSVAETPSVEELATTAAGFDASELDLPFADFSRLVARRRGIADACESRGVALEIRNALRELAKRELATV